MVRVAVPFCRVPVPIVVAPSRKVTVPVGVPPGLATVAVNATICPNTEGLASLVTVVLVSAVLTTWGLPVSDPVLPLKLPSPL